MGKNHIMSQWALGFSSNDTSSSYKSKVMCNLPIKKKMQMEIKKRTWKILILFLRRNFFLFMLNRVQYYSGSWSCKDGGLWPIQKFLSTKWTKNIGKKCDAMLAAPWTKTLTT